MSAASDPPAAFPWEAVIAAGLGSMRLSPAAFWAMTPREFALAAGLGTSGAAAPGRARLCELMRLYPDGEREGTG